MVLQTCQRCGYVFPDYRQGGAAAIDSRQETTADLWIGMWERQYRLCDNCGAELQDWIHKFMAAVTPYGYKGSVTEGAEIE